MIRHETTYHPNLTLATFKEYHNDILVREEIHNEDGFMVFLKEYSNGKLVKHETNTATGHPIYSLRIGDEEIFWYKYVYEDGKLSWFFNSGGGKVTYGEDGAIKSMGKINLVSDFPYK